MIRVSEAERRFVEGGIAADVRTDGRSRLDYRQLSVSCGVLPQSNGSARVRLAQGNTEVVASVKADLSAPSPESPDEGVLECNVECWTSASPHFFGKAAADINLELTDQLNRTLVDSHAFDLKSLCVSRSKFAWHIYVDVLVLNSGGSLADVCALGAVAALSDVRLPGLKLLAGEHEGDVDVDVDDNPLASTRLSIADLPLTMSFHVINNALVVDARLEEEACAQGRMLISLNRSGKIFACRSDGDSSLKPALIHGALNAASNLVGNLFSSMDDAVSSSDDAPLDLFANIEL